MHNSNSSALFNIPIAFGLLLLHSAAGTLRPAFAEAPPLVVAISEVQTSSDADDDQMLLADIAGDILAQSIEHGFREGGVFAKFMRVDTPPTENEARRAWAVDLNGAGANYYLATELQFLASGYVLRVQPIDLSSAKSDEWVWSGPVETTVIAGRGEPDLASIQDELTNVSHRVVQMIARGAQTIRCWCIEPIFPDPITDVVSRQLTLELPFYLSNVESLSGKYLFVGLRVTEYRAQCVSRSTDRKEYDPQGYVISGEVRKDVENTLLVRLFLSSLNTNVPLLNARYGIDQTESISMAVAQRVSSVLLEMYPLR